MYHRRNFRLTKPPMVFVGMKLRCRCRVADANDDTDAGDSDTVRASTAGPLFASLSLPARHSLSRSRLRAESSVSTTPHTDTSLFLCPLSAALRAR